MRKFLFLILFCTALTGNLFAAETYFDLNKRSYTFEELIKPSKTVFFIWTSWCPSCRNELVRLFKDASIGEGVNIYFVNLGESSSDVRKVLEKLDAPKNIYNKILLDPFESMGSRFFLSGVPTVIYFKDGVPVRTAHSLTKELLSYVYPEETLPEQVGTIVEPNKIKK